MSDEQKVKDEEKENENFRKTNMPFPLWNFLWQSQLSSKFYHFSPPE